MWLALSDGAKLYYDDKGQGDLTVLVHGSLGDYRDWADQVPFLSNRGFRVVSYSRRNHYPNPWRNYPSNYSLLTERDDLVSLLKELKEPAYLIGHSYGGFAAALAARDDPALVRKLVLAEPPIFTLLKDREDVALSLKFLSETIEPGKKYLKEDNFELGIRVFLEGISGIKGVYDKLKPQFRQVMLDNSKTAVAEIEITSERDPFDCEDARRINVPTLLVKAEGSPRILRSIVLELAKCIPASQVATIARSSHGMIWDNPKIFNESVLEFLRAVNK